MSSTLAKPVPWALTSTSVRASAICSAADMLSNFILVALSPAGLAFRILASTPRFEMRREVVRFISVMRPGPPGRGAGGGGTPEPRLRCDASSEGMRKQLVREAAGRRAT